MSQRASYERRCTPAINVHGHSAPARSETDALRRSDLDIRRSNYRRRLCYLGTQFGGHDLRRRDLKPTSSNARPPAQRQPHVSAEDRSETRHGWCSRRRVVTCHRETLCDLISSGCSRSRGTRGVPLVAASQNIAQLADSPSSEGHCVRLGRRTYVTVIRPTRCYNARTGVRYHLPNRGLRIDGE